MRNVAGLSQTESQKSSDMFLKCRYMDEITGGKGIVFATVSYTHLVLQSVVKALFDIESDFVKVNIHMGCNAVIAVSYTHLMKPTPKCGKRSCSLKSVPVRCVSY